MKFLFFDIETNGLPKVYNASYTDLDNWPRVTQLAWALVDQGGNVLRQKCDLIKPDGWVMPTAKFWVDNGFTQERSMELGVPIKGVCFEFINAKIEADVLVAHNIKFDHPIMWAEIIRSGYLPRNGMTKICTMMQSTQHCGIKGANGRVKWPKLEELHTFLFKKNFEGAHDALADVLACKDCFFELVARKVINPFTTAAV